MRVRIAALALTLGAPIALASADSHERHHRGRAVPTAAPDRATRALYRKECGSCHLDYPPGFLPAASWRRMMEGLERHFAQNAELEPEAQSRLERWLVENAAETGSAHKSGKMLRSIQGEAPLRITEVPYFRRKHREIDPGAVTRPTVRSWANCGACHPGAEKWDFDDDRAKIPARWP